MRALRWMQKGVVMARTLEDFIAVAARQLEADGWRIARCHSGRDAAWHLAARKGERWRVVQVLVPATVPASRLHDKRRLGQAAQLSTRSGRMEQWHAHVRPGGRVTFGCDALSGTAWGRDETALQVRERLGAPNEELGAAAVVAAAQPPASPRTIAPL